MGYVLLSVCHLSHLIGKKTVNPTISKRGILPSILGMLTLMRGAAIKWHRQKRQESVISPILIWMGISGDVAKMPAKCRLEIGGILKIAFQYFCFGRGGKRKAWNDPHGLFVYF